MAQENVRVLIALDSNKVTYEATLWYMEEMYQKHHEIFIFHLAISPTILTPVGGKEINQWAHDQFEAKEQKLKEGVEALREIFDVPENMFHYHTMEPSDQEFKAEHLGKIIVDETERLKIDMIVMGCRNVTQKRFLGSVSDYILKNTEACCMIKKFEKHDVKKMDSMCEVEDVKVEYS